MPQLHITLPSDFSNTPYTIEASTLHAAIRRGARLYLVYSCRGPSRGPEARLKRCGGGLEHQINWLAIRGGIVVDHQQHDVESCWNDVYGGIDGWRGAKLFWTSEDLNGAYTCCFDSTFPEGGLQIQKYERRPNS